MPEEIVVVNRADVVSNIVVINTYSDEDWQLPFVTDDFQKSVVVPGISDKIFPQTCTFCVFCISNCRKFASLSTILSVWTAILARSCTFTGFCNLTGFAVDCGACMSCAGTVSSSLPSNSLIRLSRSL